MALTTFRGNGYAKDPCLGQKSDSVQKIKLKLWCYGFNPSKRNNYVMNIDLCVYIHALSFFPYEHSLAVDFICRLATDRFFLWCFACLGATSWRITVLEIHTHTHTHSDHVTDVFNFAHRSSAKRTIYKDLACSFRWTISSCAIAGYPHSISRRSIYRSWLISG